MSDTATSKAIRSLQTQLREEKVAHSVTRNQLQAEIQRWKWLVRPKVYDLMGTYPPLRKLLVVLTEAAELQDPMRGAPTEDTIRTETTELTPTERGVISHRRHRHHVKVLGEELEHLRKKFNEELDDRTHRMAQMVGGSEWEYPLPPKPVCHRKGCWKRGAQQSYLAYWDGCEGCGRSFDRESVSA